MCADDDDNEKDAVGPVLGSREQSRRGNSDLILHRLLDESRCLILKLDKIGCLILN